MREKRSCAVVEGKCTGRGGRWQLVVWISAFQTGPMAIPHALRLVVAMPDSACLLCPAVDH